MLGWGVDYIIFISLDFRVNCGWIGVMVFFWILLGVKLWVWCSLFGDFFILVILEMVVRNLWCVVVYGDY